MPPCAMPPCAMPPCAMPPCVMPPCAMPPCACAPCAMDNKDSRVRALRVLTARPAPCPCRVLAVPVLTPLRDFAAPRIGRRREARNGYPYIRGLSARVQGLQAGPGRPGTWPNLQIGLSPGRGQECGHHPSLYWAGPLRSVPMPWLWRAMLSVWQHAAYA
jgi:hypothetical protein